MRSVLIALATVLPVAAAAQSVGIPNYYESTECHPAAYQSLVGQPLGQVMQAGVSDGPMVRVFGPGAILSDEFNPNRVNIVSDDGRTITRVYCG